MAYKDALIAEMKMEMAATRKILERVPTEKNDWKPHEKSMKLGNLANHVAELPTWTGFIMNGPELDLSNMNYKPVIPQSTEEFLHKLDANTADAVAALEHATDESFDEMWTLRNGHHVIFSLPKKVVMRSMVFSHHYHHRGQLSVYLRLLDIQVPGMYGPSFDDTAALAAAQVTSEAAAN